MSARDRKSIRIIVNGKNAGDPALPEAAGQAQRQGHRVELRITRNAGDAARFAADRPDTPLDIIVAA